METSNYITTIAGRLNVALTRLGQGPQDPVILGLYALLVLSKGTATTDEDVHDAWAVWRTATRPDHPGLIRYGELDPDTQAIDSPFRIAVHQVAAEIEAMDPDCVFCRIVTGDATATIVAEWHDAIVIRPRNPVTPGHLLVIPRVHVANFTTDPDITAAVARRAARLTDSSANLITSAGTAATQTVFHLHFHIVPRTDGDDLQLPWTILRKPTSHHPAFLKENP